jgi:hypothetical protein
MTEQDFKKSLRTLGLTKKSFSDTICISEIAVKRWFKDDYKMPKYVEVLLNYMLELNKYKKIENELKNIKQSIETLNK